MVEKITIVLASPSDLSEERKMIKNLVDSFNTTYMRNNICIDLRMWENSTPGMNINGPQGRIDDDLGIDEADLFICMYWKKIGPKLQNENVAGTEHELNLALDSYGKRGKPDIKVFFKDTNNSEETDDLKEINRIAETLQSKGLYTKFSDGQSLNNYVSKILQQEILKITRQRHINPKINNYIEVSNTEDFITNLSSNNKLVLNAGYYDMLNFNNHNNSKVFKESVFDGEQLIVSDISNVTIVGDNSTLLVNPRYANVICFRNCYNIKMIGLTLGHTPRKGSCMGSVLRFEKCHDIQLDTLELYGCGTYGIEMEDCSNIRTNGVSIYECSYGALKIDSSDFQFINSMIYDCNKTAGCIIEATNSQLNFSNVSIHDNHIDNYLIYLSDSDLSCRGVDIYSNSFAGLCNENITYGAYGVNEEGNKIIGEDEYFYSVYSTKKTTRYMYQQIKDFVLKQGQIVEAIYEDGDFNIDIISPSLDNLSKVEDYISEFNDVDISCG